MRDFAFADAAMPVLPRHNRSTLVIAALVHVVVITFLIQVKNHPTRVSSAGSPFGSMTAYVPGTIAAPPAAAAAKPATPKTPALTTRAAKAIPKDESDAQAASGSPGVAGTGQGSSSGPVRLGSGGNLTLVKRVQPIYPTLMQSARMSGQVVLDAIIKADGTIGEVTVLRATNDAFAQSAIAAVKQWRYTAPGFEGILTVSVNFTLNG
jgi:TonB family protein